MDKIIKEELSQDKYVISDDTPLCVDGLGAVLKKDGGYKLITDCKRGGPKNCQDGGKMKLDL